MLASFLGLPTV